MIKGLKYYLSQGYCEKKSNKIIVDRIVEDWSDDWILIPSEYFTYIVKKYTGSKWDFSITLDAKQGMELMKRIPND